MSVPHFLLAVLLIPFVLVLASQLSVTMDSWGHQRTENLTKDHAAVDTLDGAVDALDDHSELKLSAFCFFYRHALVHPAVGMIAVIGAVTHTTVNGFSHGKFSRGTSHLGFSFPWFRWLHAKSDFPR